MFDFIDLLALKDLVSLRLLYAHDELLKETICNEPTDSILSLIEFYDELLYKINKALGEAYDRNRDIT